MGTPSLRVYWPDASARASRADPPNWRRPGLTLHGDDGTARLALSETPALNGDPDSRQAYLDGTVATYAVLVPAHGELWEVVKRWRVYVHDRFEDSDASWVLGGLLDFQGRLEAPMTVPPRRARAGALVDGATLATVPELTVRRARGPVIRARVAGEAGCSRTPWPGGCRGERVQA